MRIVLAGGERIGFECLEMLVESKIDVVSVLIDSKNNLETSRLENLARQSGLKVIEVSNINDHLFINELEKSKPDLLINAAFLQIYKSEVLSVPALGCINFHPGPLPRYGGSNGWVWAIINGEKEYGVAFHYMKERVDSGEIVASRNFAIEPDETGLSLLSKCYTHGADLFRTLVDDISSGRLRSYPQDLSLRTYYYNTVPFEGMIDPGWPAGKISSFVKALSFHPFPNPLSPPMIASGNEKIIVRQARTLDDSLPGRSPGEVVDIIEEGVVMQTGDRLLVLTLSDPQRPDWESSALCDAKGIFRGAVLGKSIL